jgi:hypothetical protein
MQHHDCAMQYADRQQESYMASFDFVNLAAVALVVGGLAAVLWEILVKDPRSLLEMASDSRRFAEAPLVDEATPTARRTVGTAVPAANLNRRNLAA